FTYRSGVNFKAIDIVVPPLGVVIFAGILLLRSTLSENREKENIRIEVNQIIVNKTKFASFPSLLSDFNPSITNHLFYHTFGRDIFFTHFYREVKGVKELSSNDYLDTLEFTFLTKLFNGWIIKTPIDELESHKVSLYD